MIYPACWGISEGGNVIAPDSEFIFYGILDCCLIPITSFFFLASHWRINPAGLGLYIRTYDDPIPVYRGNLAVEKAAATNGHDMPAATDGATGGAVAPDASLAATAANV